MISVAAALGAKPFSLHLMRVLDQKIVAAGQSPEVAILYSVCATVALAFIIPLANSRWKYFRKVLAEMPRGPMVEAICSSGTP